MEPKEETEVPILPEKGDSLYIPHAPRKGIEVGYRIAPHVTHVDLTHNQIETISNLEKLTCLKKLVLRQNIIRKIDGVEGLESLEWLDLYDNRITTLENLDIPTLTTLDVSFNLIRSLEPLPSSGLPTSIRELFFISNKISKIEGLSSFTNLNNLELGGNRIRVIENLDSLTNLTKLWLGQNKITQISGLDSLVQLRILSIQANRITEITGLESLTKLEELYLSENGITEIKGLDTLTSLCTLDLAQNRITKIENLTMLTQLEELWCNHNMVEDYSFISVLSHLTSLSTLYLHDNPLNLDGIEKDSTYYRKVSSSLPSLTQLDANSITRSSLVM